MIRLLIATNNRHKAEEIGKILAGVPLELATYRDFPAIPEPVEDRETIEANAAKKATHAATLSGLWSLADDTGLEVGALGGAPGVYSARYAGEGCSFEDNNRKLLGALKGIPAERRKAAFRTVMALASPEGAVTLEEGRLDGMILAELKGANGFGYDPVFFVPRLGRTLAELTMEEKNAVSHRAAALAKMRPHLARLAALPIP